MTHIPPGSVMVDKGAVTKFCGTCNTWVPTSEEVRTCPECGNAFNGRGKGYLTRGEKSTYLTEVRRRIFLAYDWTSVPNLASAAILALDIDDTGIRRRLLDFARDEMEGMVEAGYMEKSNNTTGRTLYRLKSLRDPETGEVRTVRMPDALTSVPGTEPGKVTRITIPEGVTEIRLGDYVITVRKAE